jgi:methionyl-tRNA formyltransferase
LPEERTIDWSQPAGAIVQRVRAFAPDPGAVTTFRQGRLKVLIASAHGEPVGGGTLADDPALGAVLTGDGNPRVKAWPGLVELVEVAPAGRRRMSGEEWARGARIEPLEHVG